MTDRSDIDVRALVRWLGPEGARAGLEKSRRLTSEDMAKLAARLDITLPKSATRVQLVEAIIRVANKRIEKPLEQLVRMSRDELVTYFEGVEASREELLDLLKSIDATPMREGQRGLIEFAARELSETGRFMRIAGADRERGDDVSTSREDSTKGDKEHPRR